MGAMRLQQIVPVLEALEHQRDLRVLHGLACFVSLKVLLGNIGHVGAVVVLREQMIEGLVASRAHRLGNGAVPLLGIRVLRIHVEDHAPKRKQPVADNLANRESGEMSVHALNIRHGPDPQVNSPIRRRLCPFENGPALLQSV